MLITAQTLATGSLKSELDDWINAKDFDEEEKITAVLDIFKQLDIQSIAEREMNKYSDIAKTSLDELKISDHKKSNIKILMNTLLKREF